MNKEQNEEVIAAKERRLLPFLVEFVKFSAAFAAIVAVGLLGLHIASAAM